MLNDRQRLDVFEIRVVLKDTVNALSSTVSYRFPHVSIGWTKINSAFGKLVVGVVDKFSTIEFIQYADKRSPVPVVRHSTAVVALSR